MWAVTENSSLGHSAEGTVSRAEILSLSGGCKFDLIRKKEQRKEAVKDLREACLRRGKKSRKRELIDIFTASQEMHVRPKGGNRGIYQHWKMDEVRRNLSPGKVELGSLPPHPQMFASESQPCSRTYRANKGSAGLAFDWKSIKSVSFLYSIPSEMASFGDLRASLPSRGGELNGGFSADCLKKKPESRPSEMLLRHQRGAA